MLCFSDLDMLLFLYELHGDGLVLKPESEVKQAHITRLIDEGLMYKVNDEYYTITPKGIHAVLVWPHYEIDAWAADEINELAGGLVDNPSKM